MVRSIDFVKRGNDWPPYHENIAKSLPKHYTNIAKTLPTYKKIFPEHHQQCTIISLKHCTPSPKHCEDIAKSSPTDCRNVAKSLQTHRPNYAKNISKQIIRYNALQCVTMCYNMPIQNDSNKNVSANSDLRRVAETRRHTPKGIKKETQVERHCSSEVQRGSKSIQNGTTGLKHVDP